MKSDTPLEYAVFQLSPKRSRCELFVSGEGDTEKLASGLLKPFLTHLKVAEEQVALAVHSIKLEAEKNKNDRAWFTKGTLERFVRFVSTPEVLEMVNTFDAEMSQLESAQRIYSQGAGDQLSGAFGGDETGAIAGADATKKELLKAIDLRLVAVRQDLTTAYTRASAAGFTSDTVLELQLFADRFGAHRLNEACRKFLSLSQRRPELTDIWAAGGDDRAVRSSSGSDMSIDDPVSTQENVIRPSRPHQRQRPHLHPQPSHLQTSKEPDSTTQHHLDQSEPSTCLQPRPSSVNVPTQRPSTESSGERDRGRESDEHVGKAERRVEPATESSQNSQQPVRRLSVQDRINLFENKQKEQSGSGGKTAVGKTAELRKLPSGVFSAPPPVEKAVLRRWSGASDMSLELSNERKEPDSSASTPGSSSNSQTQSGSFANVSDDKDLSGLRDSANFKAEIQVGQGRLDYSLSNDRGVAQTQVGCSLDKERDSRTGITGSDTQLKGIPGRPSDSVLRERTISEPQLKASSGGSESVGYKDQKRYEAQSREFLDRGEDFDLKNQSVSQSQFKSFPGGAEQVRLKNQATSQTLLRTSSDKAEGTGVRDQVAFQTQTGSLACQVNVVGLKDRNSPGIQIGDCVSTEDDDESGEFSNKLEDAGPRDQRAVHLKFKASSSTVGDTGLDLKLPLASKIQSKTSLWSFEGGKNRKSSQLEYQGLEGGLASSQSQWKSFPGVVEEVQKTNLVSYEVQCSGFPAKTEDRGHQGMKLQRQTSAPEQNKKLHGRRIEKNPVFGNNEPVFPGMKLTESRDICGSVSSAPMAQNFRQPKGNQELNDELQVKANELERLFAEHKLRVPMDQSVSVRRSRQGDMQVDQFSSSIGRKPGDVPPTSLPDKNPVREPSGSSSTMADFDVNSIMKMVDGQDHGDTMKQNISNICLSEDSRGKFYDRYMKKRNAKLKEEWDSKRAQKEAKMKAMQDSLEHSRAELKSSFTGSADRQKSILNAQRRAEKLRSFNVRSAMKNREQQATETFQSEENGDISKNPEQLHCGQDIFVSETFLGDGSSRNSQTKKLLSNKSFSSSISRTSVVPAPRASAKVSNSNSGRRRIQLENPLAQSVPNFSDLRKENTKPSSGISKTTPRSQYRNHTHSKSANEEIFPVKEDKAQHSQSMKKSSASTGELKDLSALNSGGVVLEPLRYGEDQTDQSLYDKVSKVKPFMKKGYHIASGAGAVIADMKASMESEDVKNEVSDEFADQVEYSVDILKEEEDEEFEIVTAEEALKAADFAADSDNEKPRHSEESEKSGDPGSENGETLRSLSQVDHDSVTDVAAVVPSTFHAGGPLQGSPGESHASWNFRMRNSFSYTHETSDIDVSVDSPLGSPASWNSHSLAQMDADASRMRKKWGSAHKPIFVATASHNQPRKDMTKGFKRLLKFGRKPRGTESLVDWVSATTSEGDDDTEDGRDLANRSSEDLRKSRMGFSQGNPSYDGFNDGELFNEQVQALQSSIPAPPANFKLREDQLSGSSLKGPRSFFSLSSFRSKGSESKPR